MANRPMKRVVAAEWLDRLPANDPKARRARGDLRRLNAIMGHRRILARLWQRAEVPRRVQELVELGAGDGTFCLSLVRQLSPAWKVARVTLIDRNPCVNAKTVTGFETMGCSVNVVRADAFDWMRTAAPVTVMVANLFLHHFGEDDLRELFHLAARCSCIFMAVEPARNRFSLLGSRCLGLIGCNEVTRHDAVVSVHAGFVETELRGLWPAEGGWALEERRAGWFSHSFLGRRDSEANGGSSRRP